MKIAFIGSLPVSSVFPPEVLRKKNPSHEHPAPWIAALLPKLAEMSDFQMRLIIPHRNLTKRVVIEKNGVEYEGVPIPVPMRFTRKSFYHSISHYTSPVLREYGPDVIHAFGFETGSALLAVRSGLPTSCFIQGIAEKLFPYYSERAWIDRYVGRWGEQRAVGRVPWMVAETEFAKKWALSKNPDAYVKLIPHPLRSAFLEQTRSKCAKNIVVVGGLDSRKGVDTVIRAFARAGVEDATLTIVGNGPLRSNLESLASHLDVVKRVQFTGALDQTGVIGALQQSRAMVIASRMDTAPNVVSEAHAIGLPVIGTRAGGIPEMIDDGIDGFHVDVDDHEMMSDLIGRLLHNPSLAKKMGEAGRAKVETLNSADDVARAHVEFFNRIKTDLAKR